MRLIRITFVTMASSLILATAVAAHPGHDDTPIEHRHSLFDPVPPIAMRPLSTDRWGRTESPYTVDAGHYQVEVEALAWTRDQVEQVRFDALNYGTVHLKVGLTESVDLLVVVESWVRLRAERSGVRESRAEMGDVTVRLKANMAGNDAGRGALALIPFVTTPTDRHEEQASSGTAPLIAVGDGHTTIGVIAPLRWSLPGGWGLGAMAEADLTPDRSASAWIASAAVSHDIIGSLGGYVEFYGAWREAATGDPVISTLDVGLVCSIGSNAQLDTGANLGLTDATEDVTLFLGLVVRR